MLVEAAAQALACGVLLRGRLRAALGVEDRHLTVGHFLDEFFGFVDAVVHPGEQDGLAVKAGRFYVLVRCHDDAVARLDLCPGQGVLGAVGAVGLHFHGQTQLVTGLDEGFGGHVSMGDAVGAGGDGQHPVAVLGDLLLGEALIPELSLFLCVDGVQELRRGLGGAELLHEVLVHQHLHHAGQHIHMQAAVFGGRNGKEQVSLAVILCVVLHRGAQTQGGQAGPGDHIRFGVGNGDAVVHIGGALRLTGIKGLFVGILVRDVAMGGLQLHQTADDLLLIGQSLIQCDGLRGE